MVKLGFEFNVSILYFPYYILLYQSIPHCERCVIFFKKDKNKIKIKNISKFCGLFYTSPYCKTNTLLLKYTGYSFDKRGSSERVWYPCSKIS